MVLLLLATALAAPPLIRAAEVAEEGLRVWIRQDNLLVGVPSDPDRPGLRPLVSMAPIKLPPNLTEETALGHPCEDQSEEVGLLQGEKVVVAVRGPPDRPLVQLHSEGRLLAENVLGRPARVCAVRLVQVDDMPGPEVVVVWRPRNEDAPVRGVSVFHIPETAR